MGTGDGMGRDGACRARTGSSERGGGVSVGGGDSGAVRGGEAGRLLGVRRLLDGDLESGRLLKLVLVAPDLLAGKAELGGDRELRDVLIARFVDGAAECETSRGDLPAGSEVRIAGINDGRHRVSHLCIVTRLWPTSSMQHFLRPRNLGPCLAIGCNAT